MPLGIELAASWMDVLTPRQIVDQLEEGIDILRNKARDVPPRHQSIDAVFEHSWSLLSGTERAAFMKLLIFRGGFDHMAAQQVSGVSLFMLSTLVDKSLVTRIGQDRLQVHDLLRRAGAAKLAAVPDDETRVKDDHSAYYASLADQLATAAQTDAGALDRLVSRVQLDWENFMAGWRRAIERSHIEQLGAYFYALCYYWNAQGLVETGYGEITAALDVMRTQPDPPDPLYLTRALMWKGWFSMALGDIDAAQQASQEAARLAETLGETHFPDSGLALNLYGWLQYLTGHVGQAKEQLHTSLTMSRQAGLPTGIWQNLIQLAEIEYAEGHHDAARLFYSESLEFARSAGYWDGILLSLALLGIVHCAQTKFTAARELFREALIKNRERLSTPPLFLVILGIAMLNANQGRREPALEMLAIVWTHPRCGLMARAKAGPLLAEFRALFSSAEVDAVLQQAEKAQLSDRYLDPAFTPSPRLVDRLLVLVNDDN